MDSSASSLPCLTYVADLLRVLRDAGVTRFAAGGLDISLGTIPSKPPGVAVSFPLGADDVATQNDLSLTPEEQAVARKTAAARARRRSWDDPALWVEQGGVRPTFGGEDR